MYVLVHVYADLSEVRGQPRMLFSGATHFVYIFTYFSNCSEADIFHSDLGHAN